MDFTQIMNIAIAGAENREFSYIHGDGMREEEGD
jgi:hypothetical protein